MTDQRAGIMKTVLALVCLVVLVLCGFFWKMNQPVVMTDDQLRANGAIVLKLPRIFSDFTLVDHLGNDFSKQRLKGVWTMIFFGFTNCPDVCPTTMATLAETYSKLKDAEKENLQILLVSLDPERDTVEKLAAYVPYFNADFIGVTGNKHFIRRFTAEINIAYSQVPLADDNYTIDHSSQVVLINPKGDYHGFFKAPHTAPKLRQTWRSIYATFN